MRLAYYWQWRTVLLYRRTCSVAGDQREFPQFGPPNQYLQSERRTLDPTGRSAARGGTSPILGSSWYSGRLPRKSICSRGILELHRQQTDTAAGAAKLSQTGANEMKLGFPDDLAGTIMNKELKKSSHPSTIVHAFRCSEGNSFMIKIYSLNKRQFLGRK
jgi:hypothetical protein